MSIKWIEIAEKMIGGEGSVGDYYRLCCATMYRSESGDLYRALVAFERGFNKGYREVSSDLEIEGGGSSPKVAVAACREEAIAQAGSDRAWRLSIDNLLCQLCCEANDCIEVDTRN